MELIEHIEVGSGGAASITFSSIPQTYTDLYLLVSARDGRASVDDDFKITINSNTSVAYSNRRLSGNGSGASSDGGSDTSHTYSYIGRLTAANATANTFGNTSMYFPNYTSSNAKSISTDGVGENNGTSTGMGIYANLVNDTNPITSIKLEGYNSGTLVQYSSATLYGIRKYDTTGSPKATGGIISYDSVNNYWVHTFTASGTFTPTENLTAEYLVIAGGGGAGGDRGGGGGAGGYRSSVSGESSGGGASAESPLSLTASTGYTVTVGAGGAGGVNYTTRGSNGSNSVFSTITSTGGGGGGAGSSPYAGLSGGSGGGSAGNSGSQLAGGSGTANQGYDGGSGLAGSNYSSGGGGGASAAGGDAVYGQSGDGGNGVASSITGSSITRAGGGGAGGSSQGAVPGSGGTGGGGDGATGATRATAGSPNTGGGGGGNGNSGDYIFGEAGGSGIVIVRYAA